MGHPIFVNLWRTNCSNAIIVSCTKCLVQTQSPLAMPKGNQVWREFIDERPRIGLSRCFGKRCWPSTNSEWNRNVNSVLIFCMNKSWRHGRLGYFESDWRRRMMRCLIEVGETVFGETNRYYFWTSLIYCICISLSATQSFQSTVAGSKMINCWRIIRRCARWMSSFDCDCISIYTWWVSSQVKLKSSASLSQSHSTEMFPLLPWFACFPNGTLFNKFKWLYRQT